MQNHAKPNVLICDDTDSWQSALAAMLDEEFSVTTTSNIQATIQKLQSSDTTYSVLITDMRLDDLDRNNQDGLLLVELIKKRYPFLSVIVITGYATIETQDKAYRLLQVFRYLEKVPNNRDFDIQNFRDIVRKAAKQSIRRTTPVTILHLSDLHFNGLVDPMQKLHPLLSDIRDNEEGIGFDHLNFLIISGDLTNRAAPAEFAVAREFVTGIMKEFSIPSEKCIFVPGNHDVSWSEEVYKWMNEYSANTLKLSPNMMVKEGKGFLVRQESDYPSRFKNFDEHFFLPLMNRSYSLNYTNQYSILFDEETKLQFLALNSCWEIDEHFPNRSSIHMGALTRGLQQSETMLKSALTDNKIGNVSDILRFAVWHHPVTGNEKINDDAFLEQLQKARFKICLHGHVHEDRLDWIGYMHPRRMHIAGAGSFGAHSNDRPESMPRLYNLLEVSPDRKTVKVHTRGMSRESGTWTGYAKWRKRKNRQEYVPFYTVNLES